MSTIEKLLDDEREKGATKFNAEECKEKQGTFLDPHQDKNSYSLIQN